MKMKTQQLGIATKFLALKKKFHEEFNALLAEHEGWKGESYVEAKFYKVSEDNDSDISEIEKRVALVIEHQKLSEAKKSLFRSFNDICSKLDIQEETKGFITKSKTFSEDIESELGVIKEFKFQGDTYKYILEKIQVTMGQQVLNEVKISVYRNNKLYASW